MNDVFLWTEIYNCGKIGKIALESFRKYHPDIEVNVFGEQKDFEAVKHVSKLNFIEVPQIVKDSYKQGHLGTAYIWSVIIMMRSQKYCIHFDSDVIFRAEALSDIIKRFEEGYSLVGPIRNYIHNPNNRNDVRHLKDLTQTYFFGFDRTKVKPYNENIMARMCQGSYNPHGHPIIDFFDPVMFDILYNGGKIFILPQEDFGSCDFHGQRAVGKFAEQNRHMDFGNKICHFSAVGSGMNFYNNGGGNVPKGYVDYAIERYALYCKIFYNETLRVTVDPVKYKAIMEITDWMP